MAPRSDWQIEQSRRVLRAILSRRDFLTAAGVVTAGAMGLAGCASADPGNTAPPPPGTPPPPPPVGTIPDGLQAVTGSVTLPAGSALQPGNLTVDVMLQTVPVSATSAFTVGVASGGPSLALLLDTNGDGVLMALLDAGSANHAISAHSTAVALLFYAINGYLYPPAVSSQIVALINADPAVAALEAAVASSVALDPHALANNAAPIGPALVQALQTIAGSQVKSAPGKVPPAKLGSSVPGSVPTLMVLNSPTQQNGILVSQDVNSISVQVSNVKRRPGKLYVYEITTQVTGTPPLDVSPAKLVAGPFDVASTEALSLTNSLHDVLTFFHGSSPWAPVNLPLIPLALEPGTDLTRYNVVFIAAALQSLSYTTFEPAFFRDPHYLTSATLTWRVDADLLFKEVVFGQILLPTVSFILGFGALGATNAAVKAEMDAASLVEKTTMDAIINQLHYGSMGQIQQALADVVQAAYKSQLYTGFWSKEVKAVMDPARAKAVAAGQNATAQATRATQGGRMFAKIFGPLLLAGAVLDTIDFGALIHDLWDSDIGSLWEVLLVKQKLNLQPQDTRVTPGDRVHFTVSPPLNLTGTFEYDWTQTSVFATLSAVGEANTGNKITTSKVAVDLLTQGSDSATINVLVVGYDTTSGTRVEIGRAATTVQFLIPAEIIPAGAAVDVGEQRLFSVLLGAPAPSGAHYRWTLTGTAGSIGATNAVTTTLPQINYTGATAGASDLLHVDVLDAGGTLVAKADVTISVAGAGSIQFTIAGNWNANSVPPNGHYAYTDFSGARAAGTPTIDAIYFILDVTPAPNNTIGVTVLLAVPTGVPVTLGETFAKLPQGQAIAPGQFQLSMSKDLNNPDAIGAGFAAVGNLGSLRIDSLSQLADGTFVAAYSFNTANGGGGTVVGSGVGRWK